MTTYIYFPNEKVKGTASLAGHRITQKGAMFSKPVKELETLFKAGLIRRHFIKQPMVNEEGEPSIKTYNQWRGIKEDKPVFNSEQKIFVDKDFKDPYEQFKNTLSTSEEIKGGDEEEVVISAEVQVEETPSEITEEYLRSLSSEDLKAFLTEKGLKVGSTKDSEKMIAKAIKKGIVK